MPRSTSSSNDKEKDRQKTKKKKGAAIVPEGFLPSYLAEAFADLYGEDGLLVLGKGLGWLSLLAVFVRFYADVEDGHLATSSDHGGNSEWLLFLVIPLADRRTGNSPSLLFNLLEKAKPPLVIVLGLKENERKALTTILQCWGTPPELLPTMITNETGQGKDRARTYLVFVL